MTEVDRARSAVFISCLGTTDYHELDYAPLETESDEVTPCSTRFIQLARLKALQQRQISLDASYILVTGGEYGSESKNWLDNGHESGSSLGLKSCLEKNQLKAEAIQIPIGATETEYWELFDQITKLVPENADIYVDLTHGFRTLPVLMLLALEYVEKVKGARIVEATYGAHRSESDGLAPTWNLEPFFIIRSWADAAENFISYGDTRPLARVAEPLTIQLKKTLRREMPKALYNIATVLDRFGEAIQKCHSPSIRKAAHDLKQTLTDAKHECADHTSLKPLGLILERMHTELHRFPDISKNGTLDELRAQSAAADWCIRHGRAIQGFTFLREAFVAVLEEATTISPQEADALLGLITSLSRGENPVSQLTPIAHKLRQEPPVSMELWKQFENKIGSLIQHRNKLNHAYKVFDEKPSQKPIPNQKVEDFGGECIQLLNRMIDSLKSCSEVG